MQHWNHETRKELARAVHGIFIHEAEDVEIYYGPTNVVITVALNTELDVDGVRKAHLRDFHSYNEE